MNTTGTVVVRNEHGLHSRPADLFVRTARCFTSEITITCGSIQANAKEILRVLLLNVNPGTEIVITAEGPDADAAVQALVQLVISDFTVFNDASGRDL
jgi:phosphotransferase system HPr (HPr) family protein